MKPSAPFESVLITGASAGIGAGLARWYARRGGIRRLGLVARREDKLRALQDELQREGCRVQLFPADVGDTTIMAGVCEEFQRTSDGPQLVLPVETADSFFTAMPPAEGVTSGPAPRS